MSKNKRWFLYNNTIFEFVLPKLKKKNNKKRENSQLQADVPNREAGTIDGKESSDMIKRSKSTCDFYNLI